jgi:hypothetical protein
VDTTQVAIVGLIVAVLSLVVALLSTAREIRTNLIRLGSNLKILLRSIGHPWIALGAVIAILFVLAAPFFVAILPSILPRYNLTNILAIAVPLLFWGATIIQSARFRQWGWIVIAALVGSGAYLALYASSWDGVLLVLLYLLPAIVALLFALSPRPAVK